jgi:hypothetical protein
MSARVAAEKAELTVVTDFLGKRLFQVAGDCGELRAALQAEAAKTKALQDELDVLKKEAEAAPPKHPE